MYPVQNRRRTGIRGLLLKSGMLVFGLMVLGAVPAPAQIGVALPDTSGAVGETGTIPVEVEDLTGEGVLSFEFTVSYTADTLSVVGVETDETIASDFSVVANTDSVGEVSVSAAGSQALSGEGTLVKLKVKYKGKGTSPLEWVDFRFNEGSPAADLSGGTVTVRQSIPVELTGLRATLTGTESIRLTWTTASETNNARFDVQRTREESAGSPIWKTVGRVDGQGTTSELTEYQFTDDDLPYDADRLTYRLRQVDTNGTIHFSDPVVVTRDRIQRLQVKKLIPNPAQSRVTVRYAVPEEAAGGAVRVRLYDVLGRRVRTARFRAKPGRHERQLAVGDLASGVYVLRLTAGKTAQTRRLTVVR